MLLMIMALEENIFQGGSYGRELRRGKVKLEN